MVWLWTLCTMQIRNHLDIETFRSWKKRTYFNQRVTVLRLLPLWKWFVWSDKWEQYRVSVEHWLRENSIWKHGSCFWSHHVHKQRYLYVNSSPGFPSPGIWNKEITTDQPETFSTWRYPVISCVTVLIQIFLYNDKANDNRFSSLKVLSLQNN